MRALKDLLEWLLHQQEQGHLWPTYGNVCFQIYDHPRFELQFNARFGTQDDEADLRAVQLGPGTLWVAVVPCGEYSSVWEGKNMIQLVEHDKIGGRKRDTPLEILLQKFPNGRNIDRIVEALLNK